MAHLPQNKKKQKQKQKKNTHPVIRSSIGMNVGNVRERNRDRRSETAQHKVKCHINDAKHKKENKPVTTMNDESSK